MNSPTPLYLLSGPTASGKTAVAHLLAERMGLRLLSIDSMMVYRKMDVGTAKPSPQEIDHFDYAGLNLADPGEEFSTGKWLKLISKQLDERPALGVGGTGLYFRALIDGLPEQNSGFSSGRDRSVVELQTAIRLLDENALKQISDPENPRRLERALAWLESGKTLPSSWGGTAGFPLPVLRIPTEQLNAGIYHRAEEMLQKGLLEETQKLLDGGVLTGTAAQAIGYKEAQSVLDGTKTRSEALEALAIRTRRYAKRQRTWFRNQMDARWVDIKNSDSTEIIADKIEAVWQDTGPFLFERNVYA